MSKESGRGPAVLLSKLCPSRTTRGTSYPVRSDGQIYYQGAWRSFASVRRRRSAQASAWKVRAQDPAWRAAKNEDRRDSYRRNLERERARGRDYWNRQPKARRDAWNLARAERALRDLRRHAKKRAWDLKRDPAYGLHRAIAKFRRGELALGELDRLIACALARIDEAGRSGGPTEADERGDGERGLQRGARNAKPDETEV